jgi:hypothetical protein
MVIRMASTGISTKLSKKLLLARRCFFGVPFNDMSKKQLALPGQSRYMSLVFERRIR